MKPERIFFHADQCLHRIRKEKIDDATLVTFIAETIENAIEEEKNISFNLPVSGSLPVSETNQRIAKEFVAIVKKIEDKMSKGNDH